MEVWGGVGAVVEQEVDGIEDDESWVVVGGDGLLELVDVGGESEWERVVREGWADAVEDGDAGRIGAGGVEAAGKGGVVFWCGEDYAGGGDVLGGESADGWCGVVGVFGAWVIWPGVGRGESGGEVDGEEGFADGGVADEEREGAEWESLGPEPVEACGRSVVEEAVSGLGRAGAVVVGAVVHVIAIIGMLVRRGGADSRSASIGWVLAGFGGGGGGLCRVGLRVVAGLRIVESVPVYRKVVAVKVI